MILITTALRVEARPLINALALKAVLDSTPQVYANDTYVLVVTGVGRVRAAAAVGYCFGRYPKLTTVVNVGIAGSRSLRMGELFSINAIRDAVTNKRFYPDPMTDLDLPEAALTTYDTIVSSESADGLVDMEGAAVYQAAARYLPPHRIALLKIVSDACDGTTPDAKQVEAIVEERLPHLISALTALYVMPPDSEDPVAQHAKTIDDLVENMRLTSTQRVQLEHAVRDRVLNLDTALPDLTEFLNEPVTNKQEGKVRFDNLLDTLLDA